MQICHLTDLGTEVDNADLVLCPFVFIFTWRMFSAICMCFMELYEVVCEFNNKLAFFLSFFLFSIKMTRHTTFLLTVETYKNHQQTQTSLVNI